MPPVSMTTSMPRLRKPLVTICREMLDDVALGQERVGREAGEDNERENGDRKTDIGEVEPRSADGSESRS